VVTQRRRRLADMGFALVLCATLAMCSNNDKSTSGGTNSAQSDDAAQVVAHAVSKTIDAGTAKAALDLDFTQLPGVNGAVKLSGAGEFNLKNKLGKMHIDLGPLFNSIPASQRGQLPPNAGDVDVVYAENIVYMKAPAFSAVAPTLKPWLKIDLAKTCGAAGLEQLQNLGGGNDPTQTLKLLDAAGSVTVAGKEDVRGAATTHYSTTIDLNKATANLGDQQKQQIEALKKQTGATTMPMDVWIDDVGRARRVQTKIASASTAPAATATSFTTTIEYFDFGSTVSVDVPPNDQVSDLGAVTGATACTTTTTTTKKP